MPFTKGINMAFVSFILFTWGDYLLLNVVSKSTSTVTRLTTGIKIGDF